METGSAAAPASEFLLALRDRSSVGSALDALHLLAWTLVALGRGQELMEVLPRFDSRWVQAAATFAAGDLRGAADICGAMGAAIEEALDRQWLAESLITQGRRSEAHIELQRALAFYRSVGEARYIREGEALLAASA